MKRKPVAVKKKTLFTDISPVLDVVELLQSSRHAYRIVEQFGITVLTLYKLLHEDDVTKVCFVKADDCMEATREEATALAKRISATVYLGGWLLKP